MLDWKRNIKKKRLKLKLTVSKSISNFNEFLILNFNMAITINSKLFPVVHVKVIHLSVVFRKKKKGYVDHFFFLLSWPFNYQVIPSQILMRNMSVSICIY